MSSWLVWCSCICHCLWVFLVLLHILLLVLTLCGMDESLGLHSLIFFLIWARYCLGMGLLFCNSAIVSFYFLFVGQLVFLPRHCITSAMISLNLCLLGLLQACHVLFFLLVYIAQHLCQLISHTILGFLGLFYPFGHPRPALFLRASSGCCIPWGILSPSLSFIPMGFC